METKEYYINGKQFAIISQGKYLITRKYNPEKEIIDKERDFYKKGAWESCSLRELISNGITKKQIFKDCSVNNSQDFI